MRLLVWLLKLPVHAYRYTLSPMLGRQCRFLPTCSHYALEALETHGPVKGLWLTFRRLGRCHPWGASGYDPVPPPERADTTEPAALPPGSANEKSSAR